MNYNDEDDLFSRSLLTHSQEDINVIKSGSKIEKNAIFTSQLKPILGGENNQDGVLPSSDFIPIIEMGGSDYLFVTFSKKCPDNGEIYGVKIYGISKEKNAANTFLYSSDEDFMVNKKIVNLCYVYREVDKKEILVLSSKEGTIFLMEITFEKSKSKQKK